MSAETELLYEYSELKRKLAKAREALESILRVNGNDYEMYVRMFAREALKELGDAD